MPPMLVAAWDAGELGEEQTEGMSPEELVYWLDADAAEREEIENQWAKDVRNVGADRATKYGVPQWFVARANVAPIEPEQRRVHVGA